MLLIAASAAPAMTLTSRDLREGQAMDPLFIHARCGGRNVSPQLAWSAPPTSARGLVLTMIDQDVKPARWSHWIVVGLPPSAGALARGVRALPAGTREIKSNFGPGPYAGPCPPPGSGVHHYQISIWAMPTATVAIAPNAKATSVEAMLLRTSLDHASLTATAGR